MVKDPPPKKKKIVTPAEAAGRPPRDASTLRSERLVLRVHPDFLGVLGERAEEAKMTRSRFVEEILREFLLLDRRNPDFDRHGRAIERKPKVGFERLRPRGGLGWRSQEDEPDDGR